MELKKQKSTAPKVEKKLTLEEQQALQAEKEAMQAELQKKIEALRIELQQELPIKIHQMLEEKMNSMLSSTEEQQQVQPEEGKQAAEDAAAAGKSPQKGGGTTDAVNPVLASMLISQLKNEHGLLQGSDLSKAGKFFQYAAEFFRPIYEHREYFFKQQKFLWDQLMEEDEIDAFYDFIKSNDPSDELKEKIKGMVNNHEKRFTMTCLISDVILTKNRTFLRKVLDKIIDLKPEIPYVKNDFEKVWKLTDYLKKNQELRKYPKEFITCAVHI